ncbi:MAG: hypothetical protein MSH60_03135 [Ruminococcus sp.]|nr:hypothetical protein [Ruminococcus sp.]
MSEINFECPTFLQRLKGMLGVDFYRLFHTPMFYIFLGIAAIIPAMILGTMGMENPQTGEISSQLYTNVRHIIAAEKPLYVVNDIAEYDIYLWRNYGFNFHRSRLQKRICY